MILKTASDTEIQEMGLREREREKSCFDCQGKRLASTNEVANLASHSHKQSAPLTLRAIRINRAHQSTPRKAPSEYSGGGALLSITRECTQQTPIPVW